MGVGIIFGWTILRFLASIVLAILGATFEEASGLAWLLFVLLPFISPVAGALIGLWLSFRYVLSEPRPPRSKPTPSEIAAENLRIREEESGASRKPYL